jgi:hypothetical protein
MHGMMMDLESYFKRGGVAKKIQKNQGGVSLDFGLQNYEISDKKIKKDRCFWSRRHAVN